MQAAQAELGLNAGLHLGRLKVSQTPLCCCGVWVSSSYGLSASIHVPCISAHWEEFYTSLAERGCSFRRIKLYVLLSLRQATSDPHRNLPAHQAPLCRRVAMQVFRHT